MGRIRRLPGAVVAQDCADFCTGALVLRILSWGRRTLERVEECGEIHTGQRNDVRRKHKRNKGAMTFDGLSYSVGEMRGYVPVNSKIPCKFDDIFRDW